MSMSKELAYMRSSCLNVGSDARDFVAGKRSASVVGGHSDGKSGRVSVGTFGLFDTAHLIKVQAFTHSCVKPSPRMLHGFEKPMP